MIYDKWMSFIKDDVKLTELVIPGSHNSGSYTMNALAKCQSDDLYEQYMHGVRHFCIRLNEKKGVVYLAHGMSFGRPLEEVLGQISRMIKHNDSEFLILDMREYYPQKFGPITLKYKADPIKVNALLKSYIDPVKYAFVDFTDISNVTMGDIRKSGKRYLIVNSEQAYSGSKAVETILPWDSKSFGLSPEKFVDATIKIFDENSTKGLYWFQTQETPNLGTEQGVVTPKVLDDRLRPYYGQIIDKLRENPERLQKVNIVEGDFMSRDYQKSSDILRLNIDKGNVMDDKSDEYKDGLVVRNLR